MATVSDVCKKIEEDIESMLQKYDKNGDKSLTRGEIVESLSQINARNPLKTALLIFKRLDTNRDGTISINEIRNNATQLNQKNLEDAIRREVTQILDNHDKNGDQKITLDEMVESLIKTSNLDKEKTADIYFYEIDTDKDGVLTVDELKKVRNRLLYFNYTLKILI
ncbi:hypothetical protein DICPUDRAFT_59151 [Dictyostelium purpureum]|uniref:EF-hand domain-containing protein n=1 Tax=Dictyostelium purpureum TaxID=5786 RepID=F1A4M4_DICPU|nr:uncharacterized protein DICPUDRAFT_59151 [Dictyostelium purpureum]EGC28857.1 hypothetical protein DICPUDRAFT_59151 [Dictyostelium purpureum]|eukprot:XP_003294617.1 hypothetical protein DICPUDRAFT_59151 [Dictyostelium purpureum]